MTDDAKVFVIDDEESVRKGLSRLIRSVGLDFEAHPSAAAFLACDQPDCPCCLVLDVRMPEVSGLELQEELARRGWGIPIIFITGHGDVPMSVRAMKAGALEFLQKPVNSQELLDAIHRGLAHDRQARAERADRAAIQRRVEALTPREYEVLTWVIGGKLNKQIAAELGMGEKTVKVHRARVMRKMKVGSLAELVRLAVKVGIAPSA